MLGRRKIPPPGKSEGLISVATKALEALALGLLDDHLSHCVTDAIHTGDDTASDKLKEASAAIARLVRS